MPIGQCREAFSIANCVVTWERVSGQEARLVEKAGLLFVTCRDRTPSCPTKTRSKKATIGPVQHLGVFAKYWQAGSVKTRLAQGIGAEAASDLYRAFVETLLRRFQTASDRRTLCYWPQQRQRDFATLAGPAWRLDLQSDGNLGQRMSCFFAQSLAAGSASTVLIGSDSPTLPRDYLDRAFELLETYPVVLGPTADGGYYLVGAAGQTPPIFEGVEWSTPSVWQQTVSALREASVPFAELPPWYDVDVVEDLILLRNELARVARDAPEWCDLLVAVERALQK